MDLRAWKYTFVLKSRSTLEPIFELALLKEERIEDEQFGSLATSRVSILVKVFGNFVVFLVAETRENEG